MTLHSYLFHHLGESISPQRGRKCKGLSSSSFLAINAEGGESIKPKAKGPHHYFKILSVFFIVSSISKKKYLFQMVFELATK
jgi:hypothetical protein